LAVLKNGEEADNNEECETASTSSFGSQDEVEEDDEMATYPLLSPTVNGDGQPTSFSSPRRPGIILVNSAAKRGWDILTVFISIVCFWHSSLPPSERREIISALEPLWFVTGRRKRYKITCNQPLHGFD